MYGCILWNVDECVYVDVCAFKNKLCINSNDVQGIRRCSFYQFKDQSQCLKKGQNQCGGVGEDTETD